MLMHLRGLNGALKALTLDMLLLCKRCLRGELETSSSSTAGLERGSLPCLAGLYASWMEARSRREGQRKKVAELSYDDQRSWL